MHAWNSRAAHAAEAVGVFQGMRNLRLVAVEKLELRFGFAAENFLKPTFAGLAH